MEPFLPLKDYQVLITRGKGQADQLKALIESKGGTPLLVPLLEFTLPEDQKDIQDAFTELESYDWIILTSKNGVDFFFKLIGNRPISSKIAVIGRKTEEALHRYGYEADFIPTEFVAEGFVSEFMDRIVTGSRVLLPKGNLARTVIAESIRQAGASCDEVIIYETILPKESERMLVPLLREGKIDIVTFTSSSSVNHFMQIINRNHLQSCVDRLVFACIGPISAKTAEKHGLAVAACPKEYTTEEMVEEMVNYIHQGN